MEFRLLLRHHASNPSFRCQVSRSALRHQVWLITHTKSLEDLIGLVCPSKSPTSLACRFRLSLWKKGDLSLLVPDRVISMGNKFGLVDQRVLSSKSTCEGNHAYLMCI